MKICFYGCRGSHPISPTQERIEEIAKDIWALCKENPKATWDEFKKVLSNTPHSTHSTYSNHTTCLEVISELAPMPVYIDMGTGLSAAAADMQSGLNNPSFKNDRGQAAFFITHTHWDHIIGLPTLFRIHKEGNEFHFYGCHKNLKKRIAQLFHTHFFPVPFEVLEPRFHFHELKKNEHIPFGKLKVSTASQPHPGTSYAYRFEDENSSFTIATDTDLSNTMASAFPRGENIYSNATALAVDSHFTSEDYRTRKDHGHPSIDIAIDFAVSENVKHLILMHHNPAYGDKKLDELLKQAHNYLHTTHGERHPLKISYPIEGKAIEVK